MRYAIRRTIVHIERIGRESASEKFPRKRRMLNCARRLPNKALSGNTAHSMHGHDPLRVEAIQAASPEVSEPATRVSLVTRLGTQARGVALLAREVFSQLGRDPSMRLRGFADG